MAVVGNGPAPTPGSGTAAGTGLGLAAVTAGREASGWAVQAHLPAAARGLVPATA